MKRRSFVKTSLITGAAAMAGPVAGNAMFTDTSAEFYELRTYTLKNSVQQGIVEDFYSKAAIPAYNRLKVQHVGVFTELKPAGQTRLFVLIAYHSLLHFNEVLTKLENDRVYQQKGEAYLHAPATEPAYERIESSIMKAFAHSPKMIAPDHKTRIFELRQYQSASEAAGKKKIEMFNDQGEIDIFKRLGFKPVFWGETVIGPLRPNLTYMLTFDDMAAKDAHWKSFVNDPEWKKISTVPGYADALLVSKITSTLLVPAAFSQI
ncbi:NIPSNAP family containing protein [Pedobacter lusitanus]|uniref:Contig170, whole genome shotgun sequence n=1 Tax=Pedobacter lusitanus TaxID=1503925 RepID=A0A0D0FQ29_9SPHI|nr:NIPSNAP family protein [Pedobacter lusitanus]KIO74534.1 NIPSNAP family containing protein [Pedobacter lusitanus]